MRILIIQPGNMLNDKSVPSELVLSLNTLLHGKQQFRSADQVNLEQSKACLNGIIDYSYALHTDRKTLAGNLRTALAIRKQIRTEQFDLLHIYWGGFSALFPILLCPVPVVLSLLGTDLMGEVDHNGKTLLRGKLQRYFSRLSSRMCCGVIVMSEKMKMQLPTAVRSRAYVQPEPIDTSSFYPVSRTEAINKLGLDERYRYVLFFRNGMAVKNEQLFNNVIKRISDEIPLIKPLYVSGNIRHKELVYYYNAAECLVITSYHEGANNSIKEALACLTPVVSSNSGDASERLGPIEGCEVVSGWKPEDYEEAIKKVLLRDEKLKAGVSLEYIQPARVGIRLKEIYESCLGA